jgi:hypothetical protein
MITHKEKNQILDLFSPLSMISGVSKGRQMGNCPTKILEDHFSPAEHLQKGALPKPCPLYF